jgi:hypothetical protein
MIQIDCVTLKGSEQPMDLYTFDLKLETRDKSSNLFAQENHDRFAIVNCKSSDMSIFDVDQDLMALQRHLPVDFLDMWQSVMDAYIGGDWPRAKATIDQVAVDFPNDGPSQVLLDVMSETDFVAPSDWKGYRKMTAK